MFPGMVGWRRGAVYTLLSIHTSSSSPETGRVGRGKPPHSCRESSLASPTPALPQLGEGVVGEREPMPRNPTETRERIYAAAYALFYRKGFQRTSLDDIAAKAGVTKRTLYYHVRSKDDLAGAMLAHQHGFVLAEMSRWMGEAATPRRLVDQLFDS